jgi:hypothetical protein
MTAGPKFSLLIRTLLVFLAGSATHLQAELQMGSQLAASSIAVGDSTFIVIQIAGVKSPKQPTIDVEKGDASGIRSEFQSIGSQTFLQGGNVQKIVTYRFAIQGLKPGEYTLSAALELDGETFGTDPKTLTVRALTEAEKSLEPEFAIQIEKKEIFLGEMLPLKLVISTSQGTSPQFQNVTPEVESNGFVMQPLRGIFRAGVDAEGNERHFFEGTCEALRAGELTLGPANYQLQIAVHNRGFGRASRKNYQLSSPAVKIRVKPLPADGKPDSFSGTVGKFKMDVQAAPLKLKQGEPISVNLTIAGEGNLPSIAPPALTGNTDAWKQYDPSRVDSRDENRNRRNPLAAVSNAGRVTFTQMIVPLSTESEIPPYEFSFFDPEAGTYRTLRTEPIPIEVAEDLNIATVAGSPQTSTPAADVPAPTPPPLEEMSDILSIRDPGDQKWTGARKPLAQSKLFWALQAPPAAALLALVFVAAGRRVNERKTDSGWAGTYPPCAEILRKLEMEPEDAREFYQYAHQFIEAWEEQAGAGGDSKLDPEQVRSLKEIGDRHSFLAFGAPPDGEAGAAVGKDEQLDVIRTLKSLPSHA